MPHLKANFGSGFVDAKPVARTSGGTWQECEKYVRNDANTAWIKVWPLAPLVVLSDASAYRAVSSGSALAQLTLNSSGIVQKTEGATTSTVETWLLSGSASDYEVRATLQAGDTPGGSALNTWLDMATTRPWSHQDAVADTAEASCELLIEIRLKSSGSVLDTAYFYITSDRT